MNNNWFIADTHFDHFNIIKYCHRPFLTVEEMNNTIVNNIFDLVKKGNTLYILGDIGMRVLTIEDFIFKLRKEGVNVHLINGDHDKLSIKAEKLFCSISQIKNIKINDQKITLCHYPMYSWHCSHWGAWLLHGHHHRDTSKLFKGKIHNVGVDVNDFKPVSFEQIKEIMKYRELNWDDLTKSKIIRKGNK